MNFFIVLIGVILASYTFLNRRPNKAVRVKVPVQSSRTNYDLYKERLR